MQTTDMPYELHQIAHDAQANNFPVRPAAPDLPLGYVLETVKIICDCGITREHSRMLVIERSSSRGRTMRTLNGNELIYDLPISIHNCLGGTPACVTCLPLYKKLPAPTPDNNRQLKKPAPKKLSIDDLGDLL